MTDNKLNREITMATNKAYTTIEQSRKLAEFLPLESADMYYEWPNKKVHFKDDKYSGMGLSCWSLAALLDVIPKHIKDYNVLRIDISENDFAIWYDEIGYGVNNDLPNITMESAVDACVSMIEKLHELNLL